MAAQRPVTAGSRRRSDETEPDAVSAAWACYRATGDMAARETLILHYAPVVKFAAMRYAARIPRSVETAELVQQGIFGLIDAIDKFDPDRNIKFETYAMWRIRGAIVDEIRSFDWAPRSVRARARTLERAQAELRHELGREPTLPELARALGLDEHEVHRLRALVAKADLVHLEEIDGTSEDRPAPRGLIDALATDDGTVAREHTAAVVEAINRMPARERQVLALRYEQEKTLAEIGAVLHVTESRACQIHTKAIQSLRARLLPAGLGDHEHAQHRLAVSA